MFNVENQTPQRNGLAAEFRRLVPTLVLAVLTALGTSWCNTQSTQMDSVRRIEALERKAETQGQAIAENSKTLQQNAIRLAEISVIQNNIGEQIRELRQRETNRK